MIKDFSEIYLYLANKSPRKAVVVAADDEEVLSAIQEAERKKLIIPILIGNKEKINTALNNIDYSFSGSIINVEGYSSIAEKAVKMISSSEADILIKGFIPSSIFLKAILNKEWGLKSGKLLSHIGYMQPQGMERIILFTDGAMNIEPDLSEKKLILENAVDIAHILGEAYPKAAVLSAVETVNPSMSSSVDAALLTMMNKRGQIKGCLVDGPLAFDNAVNAEAAKHKGIDSEVSGDPDILLFPNIETGNVIYKGLYFYSNAKLAGTIVGASAPIVLTSRSDSTETKLNSIAVSAFLANKTLGSKM